MKLINRIICLVLILVLNACSLYADNTPKPTPLTSFNPEVSLKKVWLTHPTNGSGSHYLKLSPAHTHQITYLTDHDGYVTAVQRQNGQNLWRVPTHTPITSGAGVGNDLIAVGTGRGQVIALNMKGKILWKAEVSNEVLATPLVKQDKVFVKTIDGVVYALAAQSGKILWTFSHKAQPFKLRGSSSLQSAGEFVVTGFPDGHLMALSSQTGTPFWDTAVGVPQGWNEVDRLVDIDVDPIIDHGVVYVASYQGNIAAVQLSSGKISWQKDISSYSGIALTQNLVLVSDAQSHIWAFNRHNGSLVWRQMSLAARHISGPAVMGKTVVVGDTEGYLHWASLKDGHFVARMRLDSNPIMASPMAESDNLYVYDTKGQFAAYKFN